MIFENFKLICIKSLLLFVRDCLQWYGGPFIWILSAVPGIQPIYVPTFLPLSKKNSVVEGNRKGNQLTKKERKKTTFWWWWCCSAIVSGLSDKNLMWNGLNQTFPISTFYPDPESMSKSITPHIINDLI